MANTHPSDGQAATRSRRRVAPTPGSFDDIVEIRPKRSLRIRHLNPKQRDEKFEKEMQVYLQYRHKSGLVGDVQAPIRIVKDVEQKQGDSAKLPTSNGNVKTQCIDTSAVDVDKPGENYSNGLSESKLAQTQAWVSTSPHPPLQHKVSPSRFSMASDGVQSSSGIQVGFNGRPVSEITLMNTIGEDNRPATPEDPVKDRPSKSARTPGKTKGHRPLSAKSMKHGGKSVADPKEPATLIDLEDLNSSHLTSEFRDATIFFIHGVGGSADIWNSQLEFFASVGAEVVATDLIGHGFSSAPKNSKAFHFKEIRDDLEAVFDKYCKRQNIVIAHSYGCAFAAVLGRTRPRRVTKLVLISGGAPIPLAPQPGLFSLPICMLSCFRPCLFSSFERSAFYGKDDRNGVSKEIAFDVPTYVLSHIMNGQHWLDGDALYHSWLSMPTLILCGKHDKLVTLEDELEMEQAIAHSCLKVVEDASHMVMMEAPDRVNHILYEFIYSDQPLDSAQRSEDLKSHASSPRKHKSKVLT